jgi:hypothetical protein
MRSAVLALLVACWRNGAPLQQPAPEPAPAIARHDEPPPPSPQERFEQALGDFGQFTDRVCQSADIGCVQQVQNDMAQWGQELGRTVPAMKPSEDQTRRAVELGNRMSECIQQLTVDAPAP